MLTRITVLSVVALIVVLLQIVHQTHQYKIVDYFNYSFQYVANKTFAREPVDNPLPSFFVPLYSRQEVALQKLAYSPPKVFDNDGTTNTCDEVGCVIDVVKEVDLSMVSGNVFVFDIKSDYGETRKLFVSFPEISWTYNLELLYHQPRHRVLAGLTSTDANEEGYNDCVDGIPSGVMTDNVGRGPYYNITGYDIRYLNSKDTVADLGKKLSCGKWTSGSIKFCQLRYVEPDMSEFLSVYKFGTDITLDANICAYFDSEAADSRCKWFNVDFSQFPVVVDLGDDISFELNAIHDYDNILKTDYVVTYAKTQRTILDADHIVNPKYFVMSSLPGFGEFTSEGIGMVQTRWLSYQTDSTVNISKVYSADNIPGLLNDWEIFGCKDDVETTPTAGLMSISLFSGLTTYAFFSTVGNSVGRYTKIRRGHYIRRAPTKSRVWCVAVVIVFAVAAIIAGATVATLYFVSKGNECCVRVTGLEDQYFTDLVKFGTPLSEKYAVFGPAIPDTHRIINGQYVNPTLSFRGNSQANINGVFKAHSLKVDYGSAPGTLVSWQYKKINIFETGGGSYVILSFDVEGNGADVKLTFKDPYIIISKANVVAPFGTNDMNIQVYVDLESVKSYDICISQTDCLSPDQVNIDKGPEGGMQNGEGDGSTGVKLTNSLWDLFKLNVGFACFVVLMWVFISIIDMVLLYKILKIMIYYLLILTSCGNAFQIEITAMDRTTAIHTIQTFPEGFDIIVLPSFGDSAFKTDNTKLDCELTYDNRQTQGFAEYDNQNFTIHSNGREPLWCGPVPIQISDPFRFLTDYSPRYLLDAYVRVNSTSSVAFDQTYSFSALDAYYDAFDDDDKRNLISFIGNSQLSSESTLNTLVKMFKNLNESTVYLTHVTDSNTHDNLASGIANTLFSVWVKGDPLGLIDNVIEVIDEVPFRVDDVLLIKIYLAIKGEHSRLDVESFISDMYNCKNPTIFIPGDDIVNKKFGYYTLVTLFYVSGCKTVNNMLLNNPNSMFVRNGTQKVNVIYAESSENYRINVKCFPSYNVIYCNNTFGTHIVISDFEKQNVLYKNNTSEIYAPKVLDVYLATKACVGKLLYNSIGQIVCDVDCCLHSFDNGLTFSYLDTTSILRLNHNVNKTVIMQFIDQQISYTPVAVSRGSCRDPSFSESFDCWKDVSRASFLVFFIQVGITGILIILYLVWKILKRIKSSTVDRYFGSKIQRKTAYSKVSSNIFRKRQKRS